MSTSTWLEQIADALRPPWNVKRARNDAAHDETSDDTLQAATNGAPAAALTARHSIQPPAKGHAAGNGAANGHANGHSHHNVAATVPAPRRPARRLPPWYRRAPLWRIAMYVVSLPWKLLFALVPPTGTPHAE